MQLNRVRLNRFRPQPAHVLSSACRTRCRRLSPATDMLAWVHASLASEQEFLVSLFGDDGQQAALERQGSAAGAAAQQQAEGGGAAGAPDGAPTIPQLLDSVFESICRPLRVRGCCCVCCACVLRHLAMGGARPAAATLMRALL